MSHGDLQRHIRNLNDLKNSIQACRDHIRLLRSTQANFDARDLLRLIGELEVQRLEMDLALAGIRSQARSAQRQAGRAGPGMARGGNLGIEVQGLLGHVGRALNDLLVDLRAFNIEQAQRMNDPTRTSSGAPEEALEVLVAVFDAVFDISGKILGKKNRTR